jgi:hypothetical protein
VVTPYGCGRGELFVGSTRRGNEACLAPAPDPRPRGAGAGPWERVSRNAANPRTGSGMQQARGPSRGENRRGGAKPRGRNESWTGGAVGPWLFGAAGSGPERVPVREWTRVGCVGGGAASHEPHERRALVLGGNFGSRRLGPRGARPVCGRFEGDWNGPRSAEAERFAARLRSPGDVLEGPGPVTVEGLEGCREEPTDLPTAGRRLARRPLRHRGDPDAWLSPGAAPQASKDPMTPRKLP